MEILNPSSIKESRPSKDRDLFIGIIVLFLIFIMAARSPLDQDLWWHLKSGQATLQMGHPLMVDIYSFTRAGVSWINHSWLAQVVLFFLFQIGNYYALTMFVAILVTTSFLFVLWQMNGPVLLKAFVLIFGAVVSAPVWVARPETVSLLLTALVSYFLYIYKWRKIDRIWWLVPIMAIWSNLHGGYAIGFILILCLIIGEISNHLLGFQEDRVLSYRKILKLILVGTVSGLAVLINPNGINTWLIPFQTIGVGALQKFIEEWASPDFHMLSQQPFIWLLLSCLAAIGLSGLTLDASDLVTITVFSYIGFVSRRNIGLFALVGSPVLMRYLWPAFQNWWARVKQVWISWISRIPNSEKLLSKSLSERPRFGKAINLIAAAILLTVAIFKVYMVANPGLVAANSVTIFPVAAVNWIQTNHPKGQMLNSYNWGGYLIWNLPGYPVFVDGRTDLFNDEIIGQWINVVNADNGWQQILNKWNVHLILLEPNWPIDKVLPNNGWKVLYQDTTAVVFGR